MIRGENQQLDKLIADGKLCEELRYSPCLICGKNDGGEGDAIIVKAATVVCRRCWHSARAMVEALR